MNLVVFNGKIIGRTDDNFTPEELEVMFEAGIVIYVAVGKYHIDLITGEKWELLAVA